MNNSEITVQIIEFASPEYDATVALRYDVLRKPIGLDFTEDQLATEYADIHLAAYAEDALAGCLILSPIDEKIVKMRQVAVDESMQNKGIGKALVLYSESLAKYFGYAKIILHARQNAVPFYENLDYKILKEPFTEVGIPHRYMEKEL